VGNGPPRGILIAKPGVWIVAVSTGKITLARSLVMSVMDLFHHAAIVDADKIPVASYLPVLEAGTYVWPVGRVLGNELQPTGSRFYTEGDCTTCPRCGLGNSTIAAYCTRCRAVLPLGSTNPEWLAVGDEELRHELGAGV